ncbi:MAG: DUF255 domain-containing protein [Mycobacteriales bacterium]
MANRLAASTSPYLRQHKDNPVDWWPWCRDARPEPGSGKAGQTSGIVVRRMSTSHP